MIIMEVKMDSREKAVRQLKINRKRKVRRIVSVGVILFCLVMIISGVSIVMKLTGHKSNFAFANIESMIPTKKVDPIDSAAVKFPELNITENYITPNEYSRPQTSLDKVNYIVVHYTANPGTDADANINYFDSLKDTEETYASAHFVIGLDGTIEQCIPLNEIAYASNERNKDSISIECCHPDESGEFNVSTYNSLVYLVAKLADYYGVDRDHIIRHYDVTGKLCPKYYVENPDRWEVFKDYVDQYREDK